MKYEQYDQVDFRGRSRKDLTGRRCWPGQPFIPEYVSSETSLQKSRTLIKSNREDGAGVKKGPVGLVLGVGPLYCLLHCPHEVVLVPAELAWVLPSNDVPPSPAPGGRLKLAAAEEHHPIVMCLDRPDLVIDLHPLPAVGASRHRSDGR